MLVTLYNLGHWCTFTILALTVFMLEQRMKDLLLWTCIVVRTSKMKISHHCLADYMKNLLQKAYAACAVWLFFVIQLMKSLICGNAIIVVAIVISETPYYLLGSTPLSRKLNNEKWNRSSPQAVVICYTFLSYYISSNQTILFTFFYLKRKTCQKPWTN